MEHIDCYMTTPPEGRGGELPYVFRGHVRGYEVMCIVMGFFHVWWMLFGIYLLHYQKNPNIFNYYN